jgi:hypothetical protein
MSVQMIELEEVRMMQLTDANLEHAGRGSVAYSYSYGGVYPPETVGVCGGSIPQD